MPSTLTKLCGLMTNGSPVVVRLSEKEGTVSDLLFCQLVQKARYGESFRIAGLGCSVGNFVLGRSDETPEQYYMKSGRYRNLYAARTAVAAMHRLLSPFRSIEIQPLDANEFSDRGLCEQGEGSGSIILFLEPARAMLVVQAFSYNSGERITGCRGSRKHSMYSDCELVVGIPFDKSPVIEYGLDRIV